LFAIIPAQAEITGAAERDYAVRALDRIARPVIESLAEGKLKERIPLGPGEESRRDVTCLEAFGRHGDQARESRENSLYPMIFRACTPYLVVE
jgi:hypothetical protein